MDELALKVGIDPVELRRINDTLREAYQGFALYQSLPDAVLRRGGRGIRLGPA
jgi:CO/xanthine dehydrogenase Mo-binding subunit